MAILLPRLLTDATKEGTMVLWLPEDIFWFEFPEGVPQELLAIKKFLSGADLIKILDESGDTAELYIDMFDNHLNVALPKWWTGIDDKAKLGTLASLRGYLGPKWKMNNQTGSIAGFATLDMADVLINPAWKNEYWFHLKPWEEIVTPTWELDSRHVQDPGSPDPGSTYYTVEGKHG